MPAILLGALLVASPPPWAAREAESLPPSLQPAAAPFSPDDARILIVRVYAYAARDDEFVEIANEGDEPVDLAGWALTDGEATSFLPVDSMLSGGGRLLVTRNATSYREDTLTTADFAFEDGEARHMEGGVPRLADSGDEIFLLDRAGSVVDGYVWGDSAYDGPGWMGRAAERMGRGEIAVRIRDAAGRWIDRDAAEDWEGSRRHRLGQSSFDFRPFELTGPVTAVLSPDHGDEPLLAFLQSGHTKVDVSVYTFTSERIASALAEIARKGARVRILLDNGPVGGIEEEEVNITRSLARDGVEVRWLSGGSDIIKRYRFLHAKYVVVDSRAAWIGSENFGDAGFPAGHKGNRGWSVIVEDVDLAQALDRVFEDDFDSRRRDSISKSLGPGVQLPPLPAVSPSPPHTDSRVRHARLLVGPDSSLDQDCLLDLIATARERLSIETFYIEDTWRDDPNPFLEGAFAAAERGVSVRILLDGSWSSVEADSGTNDEVVAKINGRAMERHVPLEARLLAPRGSIERLHNKGVVADGRTVVVSSMNWALGSATENREIGILLEDPAIASRFEAAFDADWDGRPTDGKGPWHVEDPLILVGLYSLVAVASAVSLRKLRVGSKGIRPRAKVRTRAPLRDNLRRGRGEVRVLPSELVVKSGASPRGRIRTRGRREEARGGVRGPEGD